MKCPLCNQNHPDGYKFCPITGKVIEQFKACTNSGCSSFGKFILPFSSMFCPYCGYKIDERDKSESKDETIIIKGVPFTMVFVGGGTFMMGAKPNQWDDEPDDDEMPEHPVTLDDYHIGQTPVTQELWEVVMDYNPSSSEGKRCPVDNVSWDDCQEFICELNKLTGRRFRIPTEAEWEFAARGGNKSRGYRYAGSNNCGNSAWYEENANLMSHDVSMKLPNELGIYDMSGNVLEWCYDGYDEDYYRYSPQFNPKGASNSSLRVVRGGGWDDDAFGCRVTHRDHVSQNSSSGGVGLRLAL